MNPVGAGLIGLVCSLFGAAAALGAANLDLRHFPLAALIVAALGFVVPFALALKRIR